MLIKRYNKGIYSIPEGYKARVHQLKPGEDFRDSGVLHDSRMEEERLRMKMFPEFRSWSKPEYPKHNTHSNPRGPTPTKPASQTHTNLTDQTHPTETNDPPPRPDKAKTGEKCTAKPVHGLLTKHVAIWMARY